METKELKRRELFDLVWATPLAKLTLQYAYTNEGLKKICKEFEIPMPHNGYWMKMKFNKNIEKPNFDPVFQREDKIILVVRQDENPVNIDQTPLTIRTKEIENDPQSPLVVFDTIIKPDIITIQTKEYWKGKIKIASHNDNNRIVYPIRVFGDDCKKRALLFMDAFTKILRYRGHTWSKEYGNTGVLINTVFIEIDLREATKRIPSTKQYYTSDYIPTGELIFKMGKYSGEKEWRDGKTKLEELLARIIAKLEIYAELEKIQKEKNRLWHLQYEDEQKRKEEIKKRKNQEVDKFNKLVALSEQYNKAILIRQYIEAEKQKAINSNTLTDEKCEWLNWAFDKADWLDPLINKGDEILDAP
ncbi:hypothetical protein [Flavobacterium ginsenosidimutans]|uniref:hypothetical protein n=1 Tax=Flavobacterium ginsenosidimutans TaxID=687844 RepID=UPI003D95167B